MASGTQILIIVMAINIMLYLGLPDYNSLGIEGDLFGLNITQRSTSGDVYISDQLNESPELQASTTIAGASGTSSLFDPLGAIRNFISILFGIIFAPIKLFLYTGIPAEFTTLLAIPLGIVYLVAIWSWIRGASF